MTSNYSTYIIGHVPPGCHITITLFFTFSHLIYNIGQTQSIKCVLLQFLETQNQLYFHTLSKRNSRFRYMSVSLNLIQMSVYLLCACYTSYDFLLYKRESGFICYMQQKSIYHQVYIIKKMKNQFQSCNLQCSNVMFTNMILFAYTL